MVNLTNIYQVFMQYSVVYTVSSCRYSINPSGINGRIILNLKNSLENSLWVKKNNISELLIICFKINMS